MITFVQVKQMIRMGKDVAKRVEAATEAGACLGCDKSGRKLVRGLCNPCYQASRRAIRQGKTTQAEEVKAGRMLSGSETPLGRPARNPITRAIEGGV